MFARRGVDDLVAITWTLVENLVAASSRRALAPRLRAYRRRSRSHCRLHGVLRFARDGPRPALSLHSKPAHLRHRPGFSLAARQARVALQQSAIRRFLQRLGAQQLPKLRRRCPRGVPREMAALPFRILLARRSSAVARLYLRLPR